MNERICAVFACLLIAGGCASTERGRDVGAPAATSMSRAERDLSDMDWLAGTWSGPMWGGEFVAHYSAPAGGRVLSHSELLQGGNAVFYEFEVFRVVDGTVRLLPHPGGKPAGGFALTSLDASAKKAVFENREKDYPTRVTYQRTAADSLVITLDDPTGASEKVEVFNLSRAR